MSPPGRKWAKEQEEYDNGRRGKKEIEVGNHEAYLAFLLPLHKNRATQDNGLKR